MSVNAKEVAAPDGWPAGCHWAVTNSQGITSW